MSISMGDAGEKEMSPKRWVGLALFWGSLAVLCWPLIAADVPSESDIDLTVSAPRQEFTNSIGMRFVRLKAGTFVMGSPTEEKEREPYGKGSEQQHEVKITKDFNLGVFEVTQKQYKAVMGYNPSYFSHDGTRAPKGTYRTNEPGGGKDKVKGLDTDDFPVDNVSWQDAQEFLLKLNLLAAERKFRVAYCLPTEAQWEYACRGGHLIKDRKKAQLPFHFKAPSAALGLGEANFYATFPYGGGKAGVFLGRTNVVGKNGEANPLGLSDMHGNVLEWCSDWYDPEYYARSRRLDPTGPDRGSQRVLRGGDWSNRGENCRAARRQCDAPSRRTCYFGFRVAAVRQN
jgi:formylglycine-generating enzyme required for sulfatase activity